jgi:hypothetical protein
VDVGSTTDTAVVLVSSDEHATANINNTTDKAASIFVTIVSFFLRGLLCLLESTQHSSHSTLAHACFTSDLPVGLPLYPERKHMVIHVWWDSSV